MLCFCIFFLVFNFCYVRVCRGDLMASYIAHDINLVARQRYCASVLRKNGQYQSVKARL